MRTKCDRCDAVEKQQQKLEQMLAVAEEALEFYASCPTPNEGSGIIPERIINGGEYIPLGTEAREAQAEIKKLRGE